MDTAKTQPAYVLPEGFDEIEIKFQLIDAGNYDVTVDEIQEANNRIDVQFVILDEGKFVGCRLFQNYVMSTQPGKRLFKEFLNAIGVEPDGRELVFAQCTRRVLRVRVKHNEHDGKTYANVVEHLACRDTKLIQ